MSSRMTKKSVGSIVPAAELARAGDVELLHLRGLVNAEMRRRGLAVSVGETGERLAVAYFNATPRLPNLQSAPAGTKNVDALSRSGDRYSIKSTCTAKKTGTIYADKAEIDKQLFEYLLIVRLDESWGLESIYQLSWADFMRIRAWDRRMSAWYVPMSVRALSLATMVMHARAQ